MTQGAARAPRASKLRAPLSIAAAAAQRRASLFIAAVAAQRRTTPFVGADAVQRRASAFVDPVAAHRRSSPLIAAIAALSLLASAGCATIGRDKAAVGSGDAFSGRLALRVDAIGNAAPRAFSAAFDLHGDSRTGTLGLATPLGSTLAEARWSASEVVLVTPQSTRRFADLESLTREALGESVPIEAWFDWLRGRPWPGAPSEPLTGAPGFAQLGWSVDLGRFADGTVEAIRRTPAPAVTVRIRLDRS